MFRWVCGALVGAAMSLAGPAAFAGEKILYGPAPAWVKPTALEVTPAPDGAGMSRIILLDTQVRYNADGEEHYTDRAVQVLTRQALEGVGAVVRSWDPSTEDLTIHKLEIIRDGEVIDTLKQGEAFVALRQEANLNRAVLDGRLTANKQLEDLRVGDVVRMVSTLHSRDPMVKGHANFIIGLPETPVDLLRHRHLWGPDKPIKWRATEGFPKPVVTTTAAGTELIVEARGVKAPIAPAGAPARFDLFGLLMLTDFASWREVSALFAADYEAAATLKAGSPLKGEADKIRAAHDTKIDQASAALSLVEERVRYLALTMGDGGFKPAAADQTWSRKFGDCKGKSVLLVALLKALGIEGEVVMVDSEGDGLGDHLPRLAFDHVIVRAEIDGKTYWMDPTRSGDESLARLTVPDYGWGLPIRAGGAALEPVRPVDLTGPERVTLVEVDATAGLDVDAPLHIRVTYYGDEALWKLDDLGGDSRADAEASLKEDWESETWVINSATFGQNRADGTAFVDVRGLRRGAWELYQRRKEYNVALTSIEVEFDKRSPGALRPDAPYIMPFPRFHRYITRVKLPKGGAGFDVVGDNVDIKAAGQWVTRRSRIEDGVFIVEEDDRITGPEISAEEARSGEARLRTAGILDDLVIRAPRNFKDPK